MLFHAKRSAAERARTDLCGAVSKDRPYRDRNQIKGALIEREFPRLCRGGSSSLTFEGVLGMK
jgi:hypothetical protein